MAVEASVNAPRESELQADSVWQLEFARLIAFPARSPSSIQQKWWQEVASDQPADFVPTRRTNFQDDRGTFQETLLALTVDLSRIVWKARSPRVVDRSGYFPTLGPFPEKLRWFEQLLSPWLTHSCPPVVRLAFSAKLLQLAPNADEAYGVIQKHLPTLVNLDSRPNDFVLQINRRKAASDVVDGLPINRVSTWSKMNLAVLIEPGRPFRWPDRCYSALELDINTAPEKMEVLPSALLARLFSELVSLGRDIAEHGVS